MLEKARALQDELSRLRRTIHMHPELSFQEVKTAALVSTTLHELAIEHQTGVARTGVVARLGNGNGPVIGIRADMDALPILEANDVPYKSQIDGNMHACGHDAHTAMLLGAAMLLKDEEFNGEIRLLFQPSEEAGDDEGKSGGVRMIEAKAIEGLDAVIGLHVDPSMPVGKVGIKPGYILANSDQISARIIGRGGHGAVPQLAYDPIFMLSPILSAMHGIVSRRVNPLEPAVLTVGRVAGGTAANVIPASVELEITLRSMDDGVREILIQEVEQALAISRNMGGDYEMVLERGNPSLFNDPAVAGWIRETAVSLLGDEDVEEGQTVMAGEDFAYMTRASQGAMMVLGVARPDDKPRFIHHPEFDIDERALPIGAAVMAKTALRFVRGDFS